MQVDIIVPSTGESVTEGDISRWFKNTGDLVKMDEPILEIETDKVSLEITAESEGRIVILEKEGTTVKVGQKIGYIETLSNGDLEAQQNVGLPAEHHSPLTGVSLKEKMESASDSTPVDESGVDERVLNVPSPAAGKMMREFKIKPSDLKGTGKGGRITKADVLEYIKKRNGIDGGTDRGLQAGEC